MSNDKIYSELSKQMHREVMDILHRYARQVENSDLSMRRWQADIAIIASHILAGVIGVIDDKEKQKQLAINTVEIAFRLVEHGSIEKET